MVVFYEIKTKLRGFALKGLLPVAQGTADETPEARQGDAEEIAYVPHAAFLKEVTIFVGEVIEQESVFVPAASDEDVPPKLEGAVWCDQKAS